MVGMRMRSRGPACGWLVVFAASGLLVLVGCRSSHSSEAAGPALEGVCNLEAGCIVKPGPDPGGYRCDAPQDRCERSFFERGCNQRACESEPGCVCAPGHCFCPRGGVWGCGGGPPPACRPGDRDL